MTDEYAGTFRMRFVGLKDGKLIKGAPGGYKNGDIVSLRWHNSKHTWWELAEKVPPKSELKVPPGESVYEPDSDFEAFTEIEDEVEEAPPALEEAAIIVPQIADEALTKRELVTYIESAGGEAKMSMTKAQLQALALSLGYPS